MLTTDQLLRLAACEAGERGQVAIDSGLDLLRPYLHASIKIVDREEPGRSSDLIFLDARRALGGGHMAGHPWFAFGARRVMVKLPDAEVSISTLLQHVAQAANGHAIDRLISEFGIVDRTREGLVLRSLAPAVSARDVQAQAEVELLADATLTEVTL